MRDFPFFRGGGGSRGRTPPLPLATPLLAMANFPLEPGAVYFGISCIFINNTYFFNFYLRLILLRLFQQRYCYNVTGQSQESEGSCKPARIKEVHSKLHSFQASLCTLTATHLTLIYVCTYIRLSVPLGCLIKQAGINIHTILNMGNTGNRTRDI